MPTESVLVQIITSANMTGVKEAQAGILGMSGAMTAAIAGIGLLAIASKSIIDITEQREKADKDLAQAIAATGQNQAEADAFLRQFLDTNREFYSSQSLIIDGYARFIRAGLTAAEAQKDMERALNISAITGRDYGDVVQQLILAEHGRLKGLSDLGVTTTKYTDAQGQQVASSHDVAKAMAEVDAKTAHGKETLTETERASRALNNSWQDIANIAGPPLLGLLGGIAHGAASALEWLKKLGEDKSWNEAVSKALGIWQDLLVGIINYIQQVIQGFKDVASAVGSLKVSGTVGGLGTGRRRQYGGPVGPGNWIVGEGGGHPELLTLGAGSSGMVTPMTGGGARGSTHIHIHIDRGAFIDPVGIDLLTNRIAQRLAVVTGL